MRARQTRWQILVGIVVVLGGLVAGIGIPAVALADATYATCPSYSTFQSAVQSAPANTTTTITFQLPCTYTPTEVSAVGAITVPANSTVVIDGDGLSISAGTQGSPASFDIFDLDTDASLTLDHTTVQYGNFNIDYLTSGGNVILTDSIVAGSGAFGINVGGNATLTNSTVSHSGSIGINAGGDATLTNSTVFDSGGQGIFANGNVTLTNSTESGSGLDGVYANQGNATLTNSTVTGSGLSFDVFAFANATLTDSTVTATAGYGVTAFGNATLTATIVADDSAGNCLVLGTLTDNGYNLSTDTSCGFSAAGSQNTVTDAQLALGTLGNNGGPTQTIPLEVGSIAIDAIPVNGQLQCLDANDNVISDPTTSQPITTDQRGVHRPQGLGCDIGAYELVPSSTAKTVFEALTEGDPALHAQLFTGAGGGTPLGYLTWSSNDVHFLVMTTMSLAQTGQRQATLFGIGTLTNGAHTTWRLDADATAKTVRLRLGDGYDSGTLHVYGLLGVASTAR